MGAGKVMGWLSKVFELDSAGFNWSRGVLFLDVALVPLVVFWAIGYEQYLFSALFGALFAWLADPGGAFGQRASRVAGFALIGAGLTALGLGICGDAWGWLVLAALFLAGLLGKRTAKAPSQPAAQPAGHVPLQQGRDMPPSGGTRPEPARARPDATGR